MDENTALEFNSIAFEKKLTNLKDSQESINVCCHWCLQNRQHHKKIVGCWLNVLKRVKVEQRLVLFYLANDVIQYSKRRNYAFVESWGTSLQKATTLVRDEKVKHKILRIFRIWQQRDVYSEDFIVDLCGLISASPTTRKGDEAHEFQSTYLIQKIRTLSNLENETDSTLCVLKGHNPKIQIESESLIASLKDRAHVDDVEREVDDYCKHMEDYIGALNSEIKARLNLITLISQAENQLALDRRDVNVVVTAYKSFAGRVKDLKKALDKKIPSLMSPVPSPDINAPSPSPDSDDDEDVSNKHSFSPKNNLANAPIDPASLYTNVGYYTPVPPPTADSPASFTTNNFSSFMGTSMSLDLQKLTTSSIFGNNGNNGGNGTQTNNTSNSSLFSQLMCPPPPPDPTPVTESYQYTTNSSNHVPLMPPPMPPFNKTGDNYSGYNTDSYDGPNSSGFGNPPASNYESYGTSNQFNSYIPPTPAASVVPSSGPTNFNQDLPLPYQSSSGPGNNAPYVTNEEYNPEEEVETWESESSWENTTVEMETPESPPGFEKHSYTDPVEYHDSGNVYESRADVDQRVLTTVNDGKIGHRNKDIDHRNLISLTGSPSDSKQSWSLNDKDYRKPFNSSDNGGEGSNSSDRDYRASNFNLDNFKLPPPPPPPNNMLAGESGAPRRPGISPRKSLDNNESIDMDLSDDEQAKESSSEHGGEYFDMPPPPFPNLSDDANANEFLDDVNQELEKGHFIPGELVVPHSTEHTSPLNLNNNSNKPGLLGQAPPHLSGIFGQPSNFGQPPPLFPPQDWTMMGQPPGFSHQPPHQDYSNSNNNREFQYRGRGNTRGRFINRGMRGMPPPLGVRGGHRGRGSGGPVRGMMMRGMQGGNRGMNRGVFRGNRGDFRGRGGFRGNFRGNSGNF